MALSQDLRPRGSPRQAPLKDLVALFRGLSTLLAAGLPLDRALGAMGEVVPRRCRELVSAGRRRLHEGASLAAALGDETGVIPPGVLAVLGAGERAGRLAETLESLAQTLERETQLRERLIHAMAYPAVLAVVGTLSLGVILGVVIPRFATMLTEAGQILPPLTAFVLAAGTWFARWWAAVILAVMALVLVCRTWLATTDGRRMLHRALLDLPGIGGIRWRVGSARSLGALHAALATGMPMMPALSLARDASPDVILRERWGRAASQVLEGSGLGPALAREGAVPPMAIQLVALGESSGQLTVMALRAAGLLREESDRRLEAAVRLLEPALIMLFGGLIGIVASALLQAVYSLRPVAS